MAHKIKANCLKDIQRQIDTGYGCIIVWEKDLMRWSHDISHMVIGLPGYMACVKRWTKNQVIIAEKV